MKEVTVTGKTVEEAIEKALAELGVERDEVDVEILTHEKKGVLGIGSVDAKVHVTIPNDPVSNGEAYLCQLLNAMDAPDYDVSVVREEGDVVRYEITSQEDVGFIIGYHGDVLDALSVIVALAVNRDSETHYRVSVDLNGYREKRVESLKEYAQTAIRKAQESEYVTVANPMKPFERMILHTEVQNVMDVVSWSEGEEPRRRVIIAPLTKVRKVDDHYERLDRREGARSSDDSRGRGGFGDRRSSGDDRRGGRSDGRSGGGFGDRRGGGGNRRNTPRPKTAPVDPSRPAKSDFSGGNLYGKIEVKKENDGE